jgi:hypothetical protein
MGNGMAPLGFTAVAAHLFYLKARISTWPGTVPALLELPLLILQQSALMQLVGVLTG